MGAFVQQSSYLCQVQSHLSNDEEEAPRQHHHRRQMSPDSAAGRRHASRDSPEALPPLLVLQAVSPPFKDNRRLSRHQRNTSAVSEISFEEESLLLSTTTTDEDEEMEVASIASSGIMDYLVGTPASKTTAESQQGIVPNQSGHTFADFAPSSLRHEGHQEELGGNSDDDSDLGSEAASESNDSGRGGNGMISDGKGIDKKMSAKSDSNSSVSVPHLLVSGIQDRVSISPMSCPSRFASATTTDAIDFRNQQGENEYDRLNVLLQSLQWHK